MKTLCLIFLTAVILSPLTSSLAAPASPTSPTAPKTLADFKAVHDAEVEKITKLNLADIASVQQAYSDYLAAELKKSVNTGDLKTYEKIEQEKKRFDKEMTIPADSLFQKNVAQVELKRTYMLNDFSIRYISSLKTHQISLMKAQNIDGAKEVQQEIDRVQALITEYASKLTAAIPKKDIAAGATPTKVSLTKPAAITVSHYNTELLVGNSIASYSQTLLTETPKELKGYFFTQMSKNRKGGAEDVQFEVTEGGIVYRFGLVAPDDEWKETGWTVSINVNGNINKLKVYKKTLIKGIYTLPKGNSLIFQNK
jgi:hypothetical protein